jgi:membrane-associated phospholipid phosphatase
MPATPPPSVMFHRREHALVTGIVLLAAGALLTAIVALDPVDPLVQPIDDQWLAWMVELRTPWLTRLARAVSALGGPLFTVPLRILVVAVLALKHRWLQLGAFAGAVVTSELCIGPLKALVDRPRPPGGLVEATSAAFPSGHAIAGAVTAFGLVVILMPASPSRLRWIGAAAGFATLMGLSRTYLAMHWLTDVVAGGCIGTGLALCWPSALELVRQRRQDAALVGSEP